MKNKQIKIFRMKMGKYLYTYYLKNGEKSYENFMKNTAPIISKDYGDAFNEDNLRIMEAEYVLLNKKIKPKNEKDITK